jgi:alpha-2-macroglobulin
VKRKAGGTTKFIASISKKSASFSSSLTKGTYEYEIPLMPRFTGTFQLNLVKVELMYFPVFYGREGMNKVEIR